MEQVPLEPPDRVGASRHVWNTLGFQQLDWSAGTATIGWRAQIDYCFPTSGGPIVQGGLVTAVLDAAMGGACWSVLDDDEAFLTADLRVEFLRATRPGDLRATGTVVRRTRRAVFCSGDLYDDRDELLATSRSTQIVLPGDGAAGRGWPPGNRSDGPPRDARG